MSEITPVLVPHESVNDESVRVVRWLAEDGQAVAAGQPVVEVEGSKATFPIPAPVAGVFRAAARPGDEVAVGTALAHVTGPGAVAGPAPPPPAAPAAAPAAAPPPPAAPAAGPGGPAAGPRFSRRARALLAECGLTEDRFAGAALVRPADVLRAAGRGPAPPGPAAGPPARPEPSRPEPARGVAAERVPLSRQKLTEGRYLRAGQANALASAVTTFVPTRGLRRAFQAAYGGGTPLTALVVFEAARLLRAYPLFNACYGDPEAVVYGAVNVGFAVDGGHGLKVLVVRDADAKGLDAIAAEMRDLVVAYAENALAPGALAGGTFSVTDLSGDGVFAFHPLIGQGQSAILGVGAEVAFGGGAGGFTLTLAFDHQLTEGRAAARFLADLGDRLRGHEGTLQAAGDPPACAHCLRPLTDLRVLKGHLVQVVNADRSVSPVCTICLGGF